MGMTPSEYFESFVEGNRFDCYENPGCIRRAFNAVVAASYLADHYFTFNSRHKSGLIASFPSIGLYVAYFTSQTTGALSQMLQQVTAFIKRDADHEDASAVVNRQLRR